MKRRIVVAIVLLLIFMMVLFRNNRYSDLEKAVYSLAKGQITNDYKIQKFPKISETEINIYAADKDSVKVFIYGDLWQNSVRGVLKEYDFFCDLRLNQEYKLTKKNGISEDIFCLGGDSATQAISRFLKKEEINE